MSFWQQLPSPFVTVAPMADVTDVAFRTMIAKHSAHVRADGSVGGPDVMWTEFVAADGLVRATEEGKQKLMADLQYGEIERPVVAQLFTSHEAHMEYAAALCLELGFDGVDINMGCPDRSIEKQGCGSAMIKTPEVAKQIIAAAKRGAKSDAGGIPVSVKTRLGYNEDQVEEWIPEILSVRPAALSVHCRTRKEMSKVPARWERLERVVALRDQLSPETRIIGNGDVLSLEDAYAKIAATGADGAMVGRALFGNPWFFHPTHRLPLAQHTLPTSGVDRESLYNQLVPAEGMSFVTLVERLEALVEHTKLFTELLPHKHFAVMKKHYKGYIHSFPKASELRQTLMAADTPTDVERVVHAFLKSHPGVA